MKQNSTKIYTRALCCALAVCSMISVTWGTEVINGLDIDEMRARIAPFQNEKYEPRILFNSELENSYINVHLKEIGSMNSNASIFILQNIDKIKFTIAEFTKGFDEILYENRKNISKLFKSNFTNRKREEYKDISAETAVSCMQDVDKAITVVRNISYITSTQEQVYEAFEDVGICRDDLNFDSDNVTNLTCTDVLSMPKGRIEILVALLCDKLGLSIPLIENQLANATQYEFDYRSKPWSEYSNQEICLTFINIAEYTFCGVTEYLNFYFQHYAPDLTKDEKLRRSNVWEIWDKWANICDEIYWSVWCDQ